MKYERNSKQDTLNFKIKKLAERSKVIGRWLPTATTTHNLPIFI